MAGAKRGDRLARAAEVIRLEVDTIAGLIARLDGRFDEAVERILACQGQVIVTGMGKAGLVGAKLSATFASLAGLVYNARFTNGAANAGEALVLDTVAAVVIGGASLFGGAGTVVGTMIGALLISVLANGLVIMRVNPFWQFIAVGVVIIIAVLIDQAREKLVRS